MIAKAKAVSHGINLIRYQSGEARNKKHPELITHICNRHLPPHLDAMGIWNMMCLQTADHPDMDNNIIRIEISPSMEHTRYYERENWEQLWDDFVKAFDSQELVNGKTGRKYPKTNLQNSMAAVWLHRDSKSGVPHLHAAVCRVDNDGNTNNDYNIHLRAQRAAERVAQMRRWITAREVRLSHINEIQAMLDEILTLMPHWSADNYFNRIRDKGYQVKARVGKYGQIHGYTIIKGNASYKASELGRRFTVSKLPNSWSKAHPYNMTASTDKLKTTIQTSKPTASPATKPQSDYRPTFSDDYTRWTGDRLPCNITISGNTHKRYLPADVVRFFDNEFDWRTEANCTLLINLSMAYFAALAVPDASLSVGGGGTSGDLPWGRDPNEDDLQWARRCAQMAVRKIGRRKKGGISR